ncbi:MAG: DUF6892 domain-containing protein [Bacteroidia bacterium]
MKNKFKDFNFKLAVIEVLMYQKGLLKPKFNVFDFYKKTHKGKELDPVDNQLIPEAKKYFEELDIPSELLNKVDKIAQHPGNKTIEQVIPIWDGEGTEFDIRSTDDLKLMPNLKQAVLFFDDAENIVEKFKSKGINASYWP